MVYKASDCKQKNSTYSVALPLSHRFSDSTLANILSPNSNACGTKFELKVDEVLFVGHPTLAYGRHDREFKVGIIIIKL